MLQNAQYNSKNYKSTLVEVLPIIVDKGFLIDKCSYITTFAHATC